MSDNLPVTITILKAIEERLTEQYALLTAIHTLLTNPEGRTQLAQDDTFRSHFLITQMSSVELQQRDQILALTEVIAMLHGRMVEHSRSATLHHTENLDMLHALALTIGDTAILARAEDAKAVLLAAEQERLAEIALSEVAAIAILDRALLAAKSIISGALNRAEGVLDAHADAARAVVSDAESAARGTLAEERE